MSDDRTPSSATAASPDAPEAESEVLDELRQLLANGQIRPDLLEQIMNMKDGETMTVEKRDGVYEVQGSSPNVRDVSQTGRIIATRSTMEALQRLTEISEHIRKGKDGRVASGVHMLTDEAPAISRGGDGSYRENLQYSIVGVLGKGKFGVVYKCKDIQSGAMHALKVVKLGVFNEYELLSTAALSKHEKFVGLLLFVNDGDRARFHMKLIEEGVTLKEVVDRHIFKLSDPADRRLFSLCFLWSLLDAVNTVHRLEMGEIRGMTHCDLHSENVMLEKKTLDLKVIDFGNARPLHRGSSERYNHNGMENDVLNVVRCFCLLYIGQEFNDVQDTRKQLRLLKTEEKEATGILYCCQDLTGQMFDELKKLLKEAHDIITDKNQQGYGDIENLKKTVEEILKEHFRKGSAGAVTESEEEWFTKRMEESLRLIAAKLFSDVEGEEAGGISMHASPGEQGETAEVTTEPIPIAEDFGVMTIRK